MPLFLTIQTNEPFFCYLSKMQVTCKTYNFWPYPFPFPVKNSDKKQVFFNENHFRSFVWLVFHLLPTLERNLSESSFSKGFVFAFCCYGPWFLISKFGSKHKCERPRKSVDYTEEIKLCYHGIVIYIMLG